VSGQLTAFLRARWGLVKVRSDSDRHHALDAAIVAACSHGMVKRLADYSRRKELEAAREGFVDITTGEVASHAMHAQLEQHFPNPWGHFRQELQARLFEDDLSTLRNELANMGYDAEALESVKTLFVSRAPQRRNSGAVHKETIYGQSERLAKTGSVTQKISVNDLKLSDLDKLIDPHRNQKLYAEIETWLKGKDDREKRAKAIEASLGRGKDKRTMTSEEKAEIEQLRALPRKPTNDGSPGPVVRTVTAVIDKLSGIPIRGGVAKNDSMLRVDVFSKKGKFYLVPIYVHHRVSGLPDRAIVAHKDEHDWTIIDESFAFKYSLHPNDFVQITQKNQVFNGYYTSCDRGSGNISLYAHDRNSVVGKDGLIRGLGVKTALNIEKYNVDVLGNLYKVQNEVRYDLA
jgi:CRISPR-associated endonuclease Csn1